MPRRSRPTNQLVRTNNRNWQRGAVEATATTTIEGRPFDVRTTVVARGRERLAVWQWYWVDGHVTTSEYVAKMYEVLAVLQGHGDPVAWVVIFTPTEHDEAQVRGDAASFHGRDARTHRRGLASRPRRRNDGRAESRPSADNRPCIAHVVYRFDVGGFENGVVNLVNHLPSDSYRHAIVALTEVTDFRERIRRDDVQFFSLHKGPGHGISALSSPVQVVPGPCAGDRAYAQPGRAGSECPRLARRSPGPRARRARTRRRRSRRIQPQVSAGPPPLPSRS